MNRDIVIIENNKMESQKISSMIGLYLNDIDDKANFAMTSKKVYNSLLSEGRRINRIVKISDDYSIATDQFGRSMDVTEYSLDDLYYAREAFIDIDKSQFSITKMPFVEELGIYLKKSCQIDLRGLKRNMDLLHITIFNDYRYDNVDRIEADFLGFEVCADSFDIIDEDNSLERTIRRRQEDIKINGFTIDELIIDDMRNH